MIALRAMERAAQSRLSILQYLLQNGIKQQLLQQEVRDRLSL